MTEGSNTTKTITLALRQRLGIANRMRNSWRRLWGELACGPRHRANSQPYQSALNWKCESAWRPVVAGSGRE